MDCEQIIAVIYFACFLLGSVVLQAIGFFSPYWVKQDSTTDCFRGIYSTVNCDDSIEALGDTYLGLEATSLLVMALTTLISVCTICWTKDEKEPNENENERCIRFGLCMTFLYFAAGSLGFGGCVAVFLDFDENDKVWGLYVSMAGSGWVVLVLYGLCKKKKN